MKTEGIVTLVFRDINTGEITKKITEKNNVVSTWIEDFMCTNNVASGVNYGKFGNYIFISEYRPPGGITDPDLVRQMPLCHAVGVTLAGVTNPTVVEATQTNFGYGEIQQNFGAPASTININTIGLSYDSTVDTYGKVGYVQAYLTLPSTLTQSPTESLDVFYRMQFPYDFWGAPSPADRKTTGINNLQADIMLERFMRTHTYGEYFAQPQLGWNGNLDCTQLMVNPTESQTHDSYNPITGTLSKYAHKTTHKYALDTSITIDKGMGAIAGYMSFGTCDNPASVNRWNRDVSELGEGVVQNIFGHAPTSDKPFFDSLNQNNGLGTLAINGDSWTNPDFPKLYKFDITGTGAVGVGTYQFSVRNHFGFYLNTYQDAMRIQAPLSHGNEHMHDGMVFANDQTGNAWEDYDRPTIIRYPIDDTIANVIAIRRDEIYPFSLKTGVGIGPSGLVFNATNYPTFTPNDITQVSLDGDTIYVGCRNSGIYKIVDPTGTPVITHIDNTTPGLTGLTSSECYGVVVGNSRLWAVFNGGLFSSADGGANWVQATFTNATITADWWRVKFIKADPTHADQRLCLVYEETNSTADLMYVWSLWWDEVSTNDVQGPQMFRLYRGASLYSGSIQQNRYIAEEPWTWFTMLEPSPTQNKWGFHRPSNPASAPTTVYQTYMTFGSTAVLQNTLSELRSYQMFVIWEIDEFGDQCMLATTTVDTNTDNRFTLYKDNDSWIYNPFESGAASGVVGDLHRNVKASVCYLGKLVYLCYQPSGLVTYMLNVLGDPTDRNGGPLGYLMWDNYGWNGAAWEKDHAGSKTTHAGAETFHDGLTIAFDDAGATTDFQLDDFYSCGVLQGVWIDGSTQLNHKTGIYFRDMVVGETDLEAATLPASTSSPEIFRRHGDATTVQHTWQDQNNVFTSTFDQLRNSSTTAAYDNGARTIEKIGANGGVTNKSASDTLHGRYSFGLYTNMSVPTSRLTGGLSSSARLGTPISVNNIDFGIQVHPIGPLAGTNGFHANINVIESGVVVATALRTIDTIQSSSYDFEVEILNDGTVNYYLISTDTSTEDLTRVYYIRDLIYTSLATANTTLDYHADMAFDGTTSVGIYTQYQTGAAAAIYPNPWGPGWPKGGRRIVARVPDDYYLFFGDFVGSTGRYTTNFFAVDVTQNLDILIDGVAPTLVLEDDVDTVLGAGEIAVFAREGFIRYSAADIGKSISATYNILVKD